MARGKNGPRRWVGDVLFSLAIAALRIGAVGAVLASCTRTGPGDRAPSPEIYKLRNLGRLHAARDTREGYVEAARAFREALELDGRAGRREVGDLLNLARCLIFADNPETAAPVLATARESLAAETGAYTSLLYLEGLVEKRGQHDAAAAAKFREVAGRDPTLEAAWYQLGMAHFQGGAYAEALAAFMKVLDLNPEHSAALYKISAAYQLLGEDEKRQEWLRRFQEVKEKSPQSPAIEATDERCRYTQVTLVPPDARAAEPAPLALSFEDGTAKAGLEGADAVAAVFLDYDRDGDADLYLVRRGPNRLLRNDRGRFTDRSEFSEAADPGQGLGAEAADFNNDSLLDLFLLNAAGPCVLLKGLGEGVFQPLPQAGLAPEGVLAARWVDYDHDGDLDLVTLEAVSPSAAGAGSSSQSSVHLVAHRNNGDETFTVEEGLFPGDLRGTPAGTGEPAAPGAFACADFDRENDMDFIACGPSAAAQAFLNLRRGPFRREEIAGLDGSRLVAAGDLNGDGEFDLVGAPGPIVLFSAGGRGAGTMPAFRPYRPSVAGGPAPLSPTPLSPAPLNPLPPGREPQDLALVDLDSDGDLDVLLATLEEGLVFFTNRRGGDLERAPLLGLKPDIAERARRFAVADLDVDGRLDLLLCGGDGAVSLWRNTGEPSYTSVTLRPVGGRDNRDGIGSHVSLFAGIQYQRRMVESCGRVGGVGGVCLGLGATAPESIDGFEVLWPNGVLQPVPPEELHWDALLAMDVTQKRGLVVSCPFLYAEGENGWRFLTDVVGIAPLDEWLPPGETPHLDPEEYVRIPGDRLRPRQGRLRLAITEELRETTYLDRVALLRVTHPRGTVVLNDESTRQGEFDPLRLWVVSVADQVAPRAVRGGKGRDGLASVRARDGMFIHAYDETLPQWAGWVPEHAIELDLPAGGIASTPAGGRSLLLLTGRIYWPDSSLVFALSQHRRGWRPLRLEGLAGDCAGAEGELLCADLGFPCGMDRTMVVPLGDALSSGLERFRALRLVATHRFLWDEIAFARNATPVSLSEEGAVDLELGGKRLSASRTTLALLSARLGYHGFSQVVGNMELHEQTYDFNRASPALKFSSPSGPGTRYGDVRPLLESKDDLLAVLVPGDGVFLEFAAPAEAPADDGEEVTYFLQVTGWAKENSFHNRTGRSIEPLPFHAMQGYPPAEGKAAATVYTRYLKEYQTRRVGGPLND